ncbi:MAG: sensor histidine kinase, partial [Candidatus Odinarchaeota archaeon]
FYQLSVVPKNRFKQSNDEFKNQLTQFVTDTLNEGSRQEIEVEISWDSGTASTWLLVVVQPLYYRNTSVIIGGLLSLEDFTKRKKAEDMADFLQSLLRHDINNKMIVIHGYLSRLARHDLAPEQQILIKKAQSGCENGMELIAKIDSLRKIDSSLLESTRKISINPILKEVVDSHSSRAADAGITIELQVCDEETTVQGGILLKELFSNLVENTIVHSNGTLLAITIEEHVDSLVILVEDDGKGIPDDYKVRIFRQGFRGAGSKGSGLGLYLVKTIAEVYGGGIGVKDSKLGGARFEVMLKKN